MDLGTHVRAIWRRLWLVLPLALLVGAGVYALQSSRPTVYGLAADMFVVPGGRSTPDVNADVRRLTAGFIGLSDAERVYDEVAEQLGDVSAETAAGRTTVVPGASTGQLQVQARASTAEEAARLANAVASSLTLAAARQQTANQVRELQPLNNEFASLGRQIRTAEAAGADSGGLRERQSTVYQTRLQLLATSLARLDLVRSAQPTDAVRTPVPERSALLAFLLALIVLSELAALAAVRWGGLEGRVPGPVVRAWTGLPCFHVGAGRRTGDQSTAALLYAANGAPALTLAVVPSGNGVPLEQAAVQLLEAGVQLFGRAVLLDVRADDRRTALLPLPEGADLLQPSLDDVEDRVRVPRTPDGSSFHLVLADTWDSPSFLLLTRWASAVPAVLVDESSLRRRILQDTLRSLDDVQTAAQLVLVSRRVRRPAAAPPRAASPTEDVDAGGTPSGDARVPRHADAGRTSGSAAPAAGYYSVSSPNPTVAPVTPGQPARTASTFPSVDLSPSQRPHAGPASGAGEEGRPA